MNIPLSDFHPTPAQEPAAMVRIFGREDVLWNRPIFKAPPLDLCLQGFDATTIADELPRVGLSQR